MEERIQSSRLAPDVSHIKSPGVYATAKESGTPCPMLAVRTGQPVSLQWVDGMYPHMMGPFPYAWGRVPPEEHMSSPSTPTENTASSKSPTVKREQKRRPKPRDGTVLLCGVCGDRALGYNFDAISCESCKAFFRRNALKSKPFTCSFDGNCKLDAHTRKFCSGCRMKKCFAVGMKKEWILSDDQLSKRRKRQQARQLAPDSVTDIQPCTSTSVDHALNLYYPHSSCSPSSLEDSRSPLFRQQQQHQLQQYSSCHKSGGYSPEDICDSSVQPSAASHSSHYDPYSSPLPSSAHKKQRQLHPGHICERKGSHCSQDSMDNSPGSSTSQHSPMYQSLTSSTPGCLSRSPDLSPDGATSSTTMVQPLPKCLKTEPYTQHDSHYAEAMSSKQLQILNNSICMSPETFSMSPEVKQEPLSDSEDYSVPLSPYIKDMLGQLHAVYSEIFEAPYTAEQAPKFTNNPKSADELFNMTDVFIRRLIRFAKNLPEFKNLSQTDQVHLLKSGIMEMFILRSAMGFDSKSKGWKFKFQQEQSDIAKVQEGRLDSKALNTLGSSMFTNHMTFVQQLQESTRKDRLVLILLFIIELMSPDRAHLTDHMLVAKCQERHLMWLKSYLESIMTVAEAQKAYVQILNKLHELRLLGDESGQLVSSLDMSNLAPLLVEVLDLKK